MAQQEGLKEKLNIDPEVTPAKEKLGVVEPSKPVDSSILVFDDSKPISGQSKKYLLYHLGALALMNFLAKILMQSYGITPFEIIYSRGVISVILSMIYLKVNDIYLFSVETSKSAIVLLGALIGFLALSGFYLSLCGLTLAEAFALNSISSLFAIAIDHVWFGATVRFYQLLAMAAAAAGAVFMFRPTDLMSSSADHVYAYCVLAGVLGAMFSGLYGSIMRRVCVRVNLMVNFTFQQFAHALFAPCFVLIFFEVRNYPTTYTFVSLLLLVVVGVLGWFTNYSLCKVLEEEKVVSRVYPFKYLLAVGAVVIDLTCFGLGFGFSTLVGMACMAGNLVVAAFYLFYVPA